MFFLKITHENLKCYPRVVSVPCSIKGKPLLKFWVRTLWHHNIMVLIIIVSYSRCHVTCTWRFKCHNILPDRLLHGFFHWVSRENRLTFFDGVFCLLLQGAFPLVDMSWGHWPWSRVTIKNLEIKVAFLLGKSVHHTIKSIATVGKTVDNVEKKQY